MLRANGQKAKRMLSQANHEYLGIAGSKRFTNLARELALGPATANLGDNAVSIQAVSGTGANYLAATFLARHLQPSRVFIPSPTWINHRAIWEMAGVPIVEYPYYSPSTKSINIDGVLETLKQGEPNDVVVLQVCAHNPTGIDFSKTQWAQVAEVVKRKSLFVVFDSAYQGFATGDVDGDAWPIRHFVENSVNDRTFPSFCVAQSFSKNFGLYGERVGALHLVVPQHLSALGALSELMKISRAMYSNPPRYGASIVETILGSPDLKTQWTVDLETMSSRIRKMRHLLRHGLERQIGGDWSHVETEIGMFSYSGLTSDQVSRLKSEYHVYLLPSGRVSICGLNEGNIDYVVDAISQVWKGNTS